MSHNSLLLRSKLREINQDPIRQSRRDPHRGVERSEHLKPDFHEVLLQNSWTIVVSESLTQSADLVADITDIFNKYAIPIEKSAPNSLELSKNDALENKFEVYISAKHIHIHAAHLRGLWQAWIYLERYMGIKKGPILPKGKITKESLWQEQISQAPWGANNLVPDLSPEFLGNDSFRLLIHYGVTGLMIYGDILCYINSLVFPELNHPQYQNNIQILMDATVRAFNFGIKLFYVIVSTKLASNHQLFQRVPTARGSQLGRTLSDKKIHCLCSSDGASLDFHAEMVSNLFKRVPLLGGVILIVGGESYYHCYMDPSSKNSDSSKKQTDCTLCNSMEAETVVSAFVKNTSNAIHKVNPRAPVMVWPYSAQRWSKDIFQIAFIEQLPSDVHFFSEIDKDQWLLKETYQKSIWDYSIDFTGPSTRIEAQVEALRERNLPFFIKTETALGLEFIHLPYIPCMQRLFRKWMNVKALQPNGVHQAWMFFGMFGSRAEELAWWVVWHPELSQTDVLNLIAQRDFGNLADSVIRAWDLVSEAIGHIPCIPPYYLGPWFLGPAHPLLDDTVEVPKVFQGALYYKQEGEETFSSNVFETYESLLITKLPNSPKAWGCVVLKRENEWDVFIQEHQKAAELVMVASQSLDLLDVRKLSANNAVQFQEEKNIIEYLYRTLLTTWNLLRFLRFRQTDPKNEDPITQSTMVSLMQTELSNAQAALKLFKTTPWLDLSWRIDGAFPSSIEMLKAKIQLMENKKY